MIQAGDFEVCQANWVADYDDPQNFLYMLESNAGAFNYSGYVNAEYDRLMAEAKVTLDLAKRAEIMRAAEQIMLDELGCIPYMVGVTKVLVAAHVKGYVDNATNWHRTRFMRIERETA
jgi:oligopeptide transport system substrate-binding protein